MELSQAKPFFWRKDWFPPDHAIRFCVDTKTVDSGDVFVVACATIGASRVANTTFFGDKNIEATARDHQFNPQVLRHVVWNGKGGRRRVVPVNVMKSIISKMKTPTSVKLYPDLSKIVDDINEGKLVPEVTEGTLAVSGGPSPANFPNLAAVDPGLFRINPYNQSVPFTENMIERAKKQLNTQLFEVNPYNTSVAHTQDKIARAKAAAELQKEELSSFERLNECKRSHDLAETECAAKKRRVDIDNELAVFKAAFEVADELKQQDLKNALKKMMAEKIGCADYL